MGFVTAPALTGRYLCARAFSFRQSSTACSTVALYALIALGLTLVYGVNCTINFAHGTLLTTDPVRRILHASNAGSAPLSSCVMLTPAFFVVGYGLQRFIIGPASHGNEGNTYW